MNVDAELDIWRQQWRSETTAVPPDLRRTVERQTRIMRLLFVADILVTIVTGGLTTAWAVHSPQPDIVVLAIETWMFIAAAWTFSLIVNRGKWSHSALTTDAFLDLSISRCRARLATIKFTAGLFVCELVFCLGWVYQRLPRRQPILEWLLFSSAPIDIVWLFTLGFFGFLFWYRRKKLAELAYLLGLRGQ